MTVARWRHLVWLRGDRPECYATLARDIRPWVMCRVLLIAEDAPLARLADDIERLAPTAARRALGDEYGLVVYDAYAGFDADLFGILSGTVRAGGRLVLLSLPGSRWRRAADPGLRRLVSYPHDWRGLPSPWRDRLIDSLEQDPSVQAALAAPSSAVMQGSLLPDSHATASALLTRDQHVALTAIQRVATGHRRRPLVLVADRGRGKSAVLGVAAAEHLLAGRGEVLVTGPRRSAVRQVFAWANACLTGIETIESAGSLALGHARLRYVLPTELAEIEAAPSLVLVDEAAALPTDLLTRFLNRYARIVFVTTQHGYEGHGRGFALRFASVLDAHTPQWRQCRMDLPVRWEVGDPLEALTNRLLMLDAEVAPWIDDQARPEPTGRAVSVGGPSRIAQRSLADTDAAGPRPDAAEVARSTAETSPDSILISAVDRDGLSRDDDQLGAIHGLLNSAHYQTRPSDLRRLLDSPDLHLWVATADTRIVGVLSVLVEGHLPGPLAEAVWRGVRRPQGHLLPQVLALHGGGAAAAAAGYLRVSRLAVHPQLQRQGIASRLINALRVWGRCCGVDALGSSFGATPALLAFWRAQGMWPVHIGHQRNASSGEYSVIVIDGLAPAFAPQLAAWRKRFLEDLPHRLGDPLRDLDEHVAADLLRGYPAVTWRPGDTAELACYADGVRTYAAVQPILRRVAAMLCAHGDVLGLDGIERQALVSRVLQARPWAACADRLDCAGQAGVERVLRSAVRKALP